jgi:hypothetical protein
MATLDWMTKFFSRNSQNFLGKYKNLVTNYGYQKLVTKFIVSIATRFIVAKWCYFLLPLIAFGATWPCFDLGWPYTYVTQGYVWIQIHSSHRDKHMDMMTTLHLICLMVGYILPSITCQLIKIFQNDHI